MIDDGSDYGKGLASYVKDGLGSTLKGSDTDTVQTGQTDFSATVTKVTASKADAVFYGGYYAEAGLLVKQLRQSGYKGLFMSGDGSEDPAFVKAAGSAANGAILTAPAGPAPASFDSTYQTVNGGPSGLYSTQAYDAAEHLPGGHRRRQDQPRRHERLRRTPTPATVSAARSRSTSSGTSSSR